MAQSTDRPPVDRKARLRIPAQKIAKQEPRVRVLNWSEVYLPLDIETAKVEAERCIQCPAAPCQVACPVGNDIPGALWKLEHGDTIGAAGVFHETSAMPEMCGRLCPQERLCEGHCVVGKKAKPVAIGRREVFVAHGASDGNDLSIEGAELAGVYQATPFLAQGNLPSVALPEPMRAPLQVGRRIVIIGGGDTSMDCARTAVRLGANKVTLVYR